MLEKNKYSFDNLKGFLDNYISEKSASGIDCAVFKEHKLIFRHTVGVRDIENNSKLAGNEKYLIFSMTKMLTCVCALQLLEQNKYSLHDRLSDYFPEFSSMKVKVESGELNDADKITSGKEFQSSNEQGAFRFAKNQITIENLFTMTAGFNYNLKSDCILSAISRGKNDTDSIVRALSDSVLDFEPGTRFQYSLCHDVLGALIEKWSGLKFSDYLQKNILNPLEMHNTKFCNYLESKDYNQMPTLYRYVDNKLIKQPFVNAFMLTDSYESGGAGLVSTLEDYALFLDALANDGVAKNGNSILSKESINLMSKNYLTGESLNDFSKIRSGYGYGLGVRVHMAPDISKSKSPIGEFGWDGAAGGFSIVDPKNKLSLTILQHTLGAKNIQNEVRNSLYSDLGF